MEIKHTTDKNQVGLTLMDGVGKGKREVISELPSLSSQRPPRLPDISWNSVRPPKFSWKAPPDTVVSGLEIILVYGLCVLCGWGEVWRIGASLCVRE